jgi:hypothetical protein
MREDVTFQLDILSNSKVSNSSSWQQVFLRQIKNRCSLLSQWFFQEKPSSIKPFYFDLSFFFVSHEEVNYVFVE